MLRTFSREHRSQNTTERPLSCAVDHVSGTALVSALRPH